MSRHFLELKFVQPVGPYDLAGYSFGAALAFEIAHQLSRQHNDKVENLILLDGYLNMAKETRLRELAELSLNALQCLLKFSDEEKKTYLELMEKTGMDKMLRIAQNILDIHLKGEYNELRSTWDRVVTAMILLCEYEPSPGLNVNVHFIMASSSIFQKYDESRDHYFNKLCAKPMSLHHVNSNHTSCLEDPFVQQTADIFSNILESNNTQQHNVALERITK